MRTKNGKIKFKQNMVKNGIGYISILVTKYVTSSGIFAYQINMNCENHR
jgi:hypothetical protein